MSIGGSKSKGSSTSTTASESEDWGTAVWGQQAPYLTDLYARSKNQLKFNNYANPYFNNANAQAGAGSRALDSSAGALGSALIRAQNAGGDLNTARSALGTSNARLADMNTGLTRGLATLGESNAALRKFLNPGVDPALAAYSKSLGQQFNEQFLPGLKGDAAVAGGLGGSRAQIGAALGSQRAQQSLSEFAAQSYAGQQERALQAAQGIGALNQGYIQNAAGRQAQAQGYNANSQGYRDISSGLLNQSQQFGNIAQGYDQIAAGRLAASQNQQGMYDLARSMPWYGLQQYAGLLGLPVQNDLGGWTSSKTVSKGKSGSGGFNFGLGGG